MFDNVDLLIVGAGPVGCVIAEQAATQKGWKSLIVEKRSHVAGNCYDTYHPSGVMIHQYGPHYFRTNDPNLVAYLSQFTDWVEGNYIVKSFTRGELFDFPINLLTLQQFFNTPTLTAEEGKNLLERMRDRSITDPKNSEEFVMMKVGRELYESFYLGYTLKQWDRHPKELDPSVCGRIPVRFNRDCRYVDHRFQITPKNGFTSMFSKMLDQPQIKVMLNTDFEEVRSSIKPRVATVYCGTVDAYFGHKLGKLPWRSLEFDFQEYNEAYRQPCVQINYPNDFEYTRTVEIKHVTRQEHPKTVISYERSRAQGDPYYPVPAKENQELYLKYKALAEEERKKNNVFFSGRLANYVYINTDQAIEMAFSTFNDIVTSRNS